MKINVAVLSTDIIMNVLDKRESDMLTSSFDYNDTLNSVMSFW